MGVVAETYRAGVATETARWRRIRILFFGLVLLLYLGGGYPGFPSDDVIPATVLPYALLLNHNFYIGRFTVPYFGPTPYFLTRFGPHRLSVYPIGGALTALPLYAMGLFLTHGFTIGRALALGHVSAAVLAWGSVVMLDRAIAAWGVRSPQLRLVTLAAYALGSETWAISSQGLWQHGPAEFWLSMGLWAASTLREDIRHLDRRLLLVAGFAGGMTILCRYPDAVLLLPLVIWVAFARRSALKFLVVGAASPLAGLLVYNWRFFGSPFRVGYNAMGHLHHWFTYPLWGGLAGNLFSPSKGGIVFDPLLLLFPFLIAAALRRGRFSGLDASLVMGPFLLLLLYAVYWKWPAGYCYGPRYMTDALPYLALAGSTLWGKGISWAKAPLSAVRFVFVPIALSWSIGLQFLGGFAPGGAWNLAAHPNRFLSPLWSWTDGEPYYYAESLLAKFTRNPVATSDRLRLVDGVFGSKPYLYAPLRPTTTVAPEGLYSGTITVQNLGPVELPAFFSAKGHPAVSLAFDWLESGHRVEFGTVAGLLFHDVPPGHSERLYFVVPAPARSGRYVLALFMVQGREGPIGGRSGEWRIAVRVTAQSVSQRR